MFFSTLRRRLMPRAPRRRPFRHPPQVECLEDRFVPTSTLYVDFGDRFPVAGLTGTVGTLRTATSGVVGDPAVAGPNMDKDLNGDFSGAATDDEDAFNMVSFGSRYATDGGAYTGGLAQLRADIM